jgi:hypothetical protein
MQRSVRVKLHSLRDYDYESTYVKVKQSLDRPWGIQTPEVPRSPDNRHMKMVRLSALSTGRFYPPRDTPGPNFCLQLSRTQSQSAARRITSMIPSGNEAATFRLVAQCLNQLRHRAAPQIRLTNLNLACISPTKLLISINLKSKFDQCSQNRHTVQTNQSRTMQYKKHRSP